MSEGVGTGVAAHPVADFGTRALARLSQLHATSSRPVWAMETDELRQALVDLDQVASSVEALRLEVLAEADRREACTEHGERSAADWVARQTRQRRSFARADLRLAHALEASHPRVRETLAAGVLNPDQARVIVTALDRLAATPAAELDGDVVGPEEVGRATDFLLDHAARHDAADLQVLGRRLWEVICPEQADAREGRLLEAEERAAAEQTSFSMRAHPDGGVRGRFRLSTLHGAMLTKMLTALTNPARPVGPPAPIDAEALEAASNAPARPSGPRRQGEAFAELIERISARDLPTAAGGDATVVVTMALADLVARLDAAGVATLDTGHRISAGEARRLAARHRLIPVVLGGPSEVLDAGRTRRLHSKTQRLAMTVTQGGCTAEHCDAPPAMCHAHHDHPWAEGGPTDLRSGRLLCGHHHRRVHDPTWRTERLPSGKVAFHRRC